MTRNGIDIVSDIIKTVPELRDRVYKLHSLGNNKPFVVLNSAFGITYPLLTNPANIVGEGIRIDFHSESVDENDPQGLFNLFNSCHHALMRSNRVLSLVTQYTFEDDATPNVNKAVVATYRLTAVYRIRTN